MKRKKDYSYNDKLRDIAKQTGFTAATIAEIMGCHRSSVVYWMQNTYQMHDYQFSRLLDYLPEFVEDQIEFHEDQAKSLKTYYKQLISVVHNQLHIDRS